VEQCSGQVGVGPDVDEVLALRGATIDTAEEAIDPSEEAWKRRRRQLGHDLQHGLATVALLAEVIGGTDRLDLDAAQRLRHLVSQVRQLSMLLEEEFQGDARAEADAPVRVDVLVREVCTVRAGTTSVPLEAITEPVHSVVSLSALWRVVSNVLDNAIRAADHRGGVQVRVHAQGGRAVVEVDDSGPGFGLSGRGLASVGLGIVQDFVARYDGALEIGAGDLGGCCVRILLPAEPLLGLVEAPALTASQDDG
jgi:signal transduction histidine kinase